jgi:hypothetical protein
MPRQVSGAPGGAPFDFKPNQPHPSVVAPEGADPLQFYGAQPVQAQHGRLPLSASHEAAPKAQAPRPAKSFFKLVFGQFATALFTRKYNRWGVTDRAQTVMKMLTAAQNDSEKLKKLFKDEDTLSAFACLAASMNIDLNFRLKETAPDVNIKLLNDFLAMYKLNERRGVFKPSDDERHLISQLEGNARRYGFYDPLNIPGEDVRIFE